MDRILEKKPFWIRYRWYMLACTLFLALTVYGTWQLLGPRKLRIDAETIVTAEAKHEKFHEYAETEGVVHPFLTLKVNTREAGAVARIIAEEGSMMNMGDTILVLTNPDLERDIEEQHDAFEKQLISYREQEIEMEQKSLELQKLALQYEYESNSLHERHKLDEKEHSMGYTSPAQFKVAEDEYKYKVKAAELQRRSLKHDSAMTQIRRQLIDTDRSRESKRFNRVRDRLSRLAVIAPMAGQLSFINVTPGQQVASGETVGEIKDLSRYKLHASLSEYYADRIVSGLPATMVYQGKRIPLLVKKVMPEVNANRTFETELVFLDSVPSHVRVGKNYRIQIELGQAEKAVTIPRGDFFGITGGHWIFKLSANGERAVRVPITLGRQNPACYEVVAGLKPGDRVIVTGYENLKEAEELLID